MSWALQLARVLPNPIVEAVLRARLNNPVLKPAFDWYAKRMKNQDSVIQRGVGEGLRFNPGDSIASYLLGKVEEPLQQLLQLWLKPGMTMYDVGANVGFVTVIAARLVGEKGRVYSFEPVPALANQAQYNAGLNQFQQVVIYRSALGDHDGDASFQLAPDVMTGALVSQDSPLRQKAGVLRVKVRQLDTLVETDKLTPPDMMKIDVEGAEADVLDGGVQVLRKARPILIIEVHSTNEVVADRIAALDYVGRVLGSSAPIRSAPSHATVVAVPEERASLLDVIS
jgi:FkbM family methyltransferase